MNPQRLLPIGSRMIFGLLQPKAMLADLPFPCRSISTSFCLSRGAFIAKRSSCLNSFSPVEFQSAAFVLQSLSVVSASQQRHYRVKKTIDLTTEQEFVCKISKVDPSDTETLDEYCLRLENLVEKGCKAYELVEYPEVLTYTFEEIDERIERLRSCGQSAVSIALLKFAKPENSDAVLKNSLRRYLKQQNGHLNKVDEIKDVLQCTDDEMLHILMKNPRLIGNRKRKQMVEKVNCLLEFGALMQDIRCNTNLLNNKTLEDIERRAQKLLELGYNDPLPIGIIGRDDQDYATIIERLTKETSLQPTPRYLESKEIIAQIPEYAKKKLHVVKPKVDFLLSKGFLGEEIIKFPNILQISLSTIRDTVNYLQQYHLSSVSLELCLKYALKKTVVLRQKSLRVKFAKVLKCSSKELPLLPKDHSVSFHDESTLQMNLDFLQSHGFTSENLLPLPIILAHDPETLKLQWNHIQLDETLSPYFEKWKGDMGKLLQLLQYCMEKESGFSYAAVTKLGDLHAQLDGTEMDGLDYETHEFTEADVEMEAHESVDSDVELHLESEPESVRGHKSDAHHDSNTELDSKSESDSDVEHETDAKVSPASEAASKVEQTVGMESVMHRIYPSLSKGQNWTRQDR